MTGDLCACGFVVNEQKSNWIPVQKIDWLGVTWDCEHGTISIKQSRVDKACSIIDHILFKPFVCFVSELVQPETSYPTCIYWSFFTVSIYLVTVRIRRKIFFIRTNLVRENEIEYYLSVVTDLTKRGFCKTRMWTADDRK